uniref:Zinc finger C3HC-type containing 1 n=1 Tax=Sphenodon punctatus TaxID=8508 RepID=A0A8D0G5H7_SPHPU
MPSSLLPFSELGFSVVGDKNSASHIPVLLLSFRKDAFAFSESANGSSQSDSFPFETTSKEAFFGRAHSLKWAGKPHELSPLVCAKYGWTNIESDMLKCSSCQAFLCASLQLALDFNKYKERCAKLRKALCTAHEKFCFWPDSPCPDRFAVLLVSEPIALLSDFLDRFRSLCQLELQLPSLKPEDLKSMSLTEDKISLLLHFVEEELECQTQGEKTLVKFGADILQVHIPACVLALCGWACSTPLTPIDKFPLVPTSPRRMITRSQDTPVPSGSDQHEKSPSPVISRTRSLDSSSSGERPDLEAVSPSARSRPVTRSMGQGDSSGLGTELPSSPHRRAKRARLCSSSSSDASVRSFFEPSSQHRDWCPWVNPAKGPKEAGDASDQSEGMPPRKAEPGWKTVLDVLLATRQSKRPAGKESEVRSLKIESPPPASEASQTPSPICSVASIRV